MKKILSLDNEKTRLLYNLLSSFEVNDRSGNRKRWKFLKVLEDHVDGVDDVLEDFSKIPDKDERRSKIDELLKVENTFIFPDREVFAFGKDLFERSFKVGALSNDNGRVKRSPLVGNDAKAYYDLEDAFADVTEEKEASQPIEEPKPIE